MSASTDEQKQRRDGWAPAHPRHVCHARGAYVSSLILLRNRPFQCAVLAFLCPGTAQLLTRVSNPPLVLSVLLSLYVSLVVLKRQATRALARDTFDLVDLVRHAIIVRGLQATACSPLAPTTPVTLYKPFYVPPASPGSAQLFSSALQLCSSDPRSSASSDPGGNGHGWSPGRRTWHE